MADLPSRISSPPASPIISVVGGLNMDLVFETRRIPMQGESMNCNSLQTFPGGKGANTAVATYRASHNNPLRVDRTRTRTPQTNIVDQEPRDIRVFMNGAVGNDGYGEELRGRLSSTGVDVSGVGIVEGEPSGTCAVIVEKTGESRNLAYPGANLLYRPRNEASVSSLAGNTGLKPDLVVAHLGVARHVVEPLLQLAYEAGIETILKPAPAVDLLPKTYSYVTHLILNEQETAELLECRVEDLRDLRDVRNRAERFIEWGAKNVIITLGAVRKRGAYYVTHNGQRNKIESAQVLDVKDTTGAGCAFVGAYAVEIVRQQQKDIFDIEKAINYACKVAARSIEALGAQEALPWADEIDR